VILKTPSLFFIDRSIDRKKERKKEKDHQITKERVRTWLRIVSILQVLTLPTSFPVVQLARPFGTRAVLQTSQDVPAF
jgi:hypothetical protein